MDKNKEQYFYVIMKNNENFKLITWLKECSFGIVIFEPT